AKNSNARFTKFLRITGTDSGCFLAKIPDAPHELSFKSCGVRGRDLGSPDLSGQNLSSFGVRDDPEYMV
ncbi:unnamed protein product, partial [marine sediment metagenome]